MSKDRKDLKRAKPLVLSLFCGCGGLDLGFEQAGFEVGLAYDLRAPAIESYNYNRATNSGFVRDVGRIKFADLDSDFGREFVPKGVIGGPPCQSFSRGNSSKTEDDPRRAMVRVFFSLALKIHRSRSELDFIVMENVPEVASAEEGKLLQTEINRLERAGFRVSKHIYNAKNYGVAQNRRRLILVALNRSRLAREWIIPPVTEDLCTVRDAIGNLKEPVYFEDAKKADTYPEHPNHWCMTPRSSKFFNNQLKPGRSTGRSFKSLAWDKPSYTVSYGHREVHVHPRCNRRLSVFEAMRLQGFPDEFVLKGTMSAQFSQVSEAVPPPLAKAIALRIFQSISPEDVSDASAKIAAE
ncbi:DNA cytosine methyltransferase [Hyphomonas sp. L-53-1-40]|uniref:DNA cytosine methyltransferase n=1 Tax=Hyphomonas sp. L-53-1-40 TaxID=1207058 RepID=UPI000A01D171|nr:DNA cytosine methyltransferase [Hyphomonas sp. L-53-1-40]